MGDAPTLSPSRSPEQPLLRSESSPGQDGSNNASRGATPSPNPSISALSGHVSRPKYIAGTVGILVIIPVIIITMKYYYFPQSWEPCHEDWLYFKKKCYYLSEEEKDWDSSQAFCSEHKAFLAVIENQMEMLFLSKRLQMQDSWIGLRKKEGQFYWEDNTLLQTDKFAIEGHAECAYIEAYSISTSACSLPRRWICSYQSSK
uniref:C-type lectin domain-containing protein n=1 Tax=Crocodylus porosus TaxID=8502 RepID=A0A7M4F1T1_CROPO